MRERSRWTLKNWEGGAEEVVGGDSESKGSQEQMTASARRMTLLGSDAR